MVEVLPAASVAVAVMFVSLVAEPEASVVLFTVPDSVATVLPLLSVVTLSITLFSVTVPFAAVVVVAVSLMVVVLPLASVVVPSVVVVKVPLASREVLILPIAYRKGLSRDLPATWGASLCDFPSIIA